jgi:hypothetical protein
MKFLGMESGATAVPNASEEAFARHSSVGWNPVLQPVRKNWIPAFAGMTAKNWIPDLRWNDGEELDPSLRWDDGLFRGS